MNPSSITQKAPFTIWCLIVGLLLGLELGTFLGATAVFSGVEDGFYDSGTAGTIAGRLFQTVNIIGIFVLPTASLIASIWLKGGQLGRAGWIAFILLQVSFVLLLVELTYISPSIATLRETLGETYGSVGDAPSDDPDRQQFGMLHGMSMMRGLLQLLSTLTAYLLVVFTWKPER